MLKKIYILCLVVLLSSNLKGQNIPFEDNLHFRYITIENGLVNNKVNALCYDEKGFIWIGTDEGLNRFDGYVLRAFHSYSTDTASTISDQVFALLADTEGFLWIGYNDRLERLDLETEEYSTISYHNEAIEKIRDIYQYQNNIWICSAQGLFYYDLKTETLHFYNEENPHFKLVDLFSILIDDRENMWVGTHDAGVHIISRNTNEVKHIQISKNYRIESMFRDSSKNIWIGALNNGLIKFSPEDSSFTSLIINSADTYTSRIRDIGQDKNGTLFFATRGGLYKKSLNTDEFILVARADLELAKLNYNSIFSLLIDKYDMLWLGTYAGGVNYADLYQKKFNNILLDQNKNNTGLNSEIVYAIEEDEKGNFYFGTANGGINYYNKETGKFTYYVQRREIDGAGNTVYWIKQENPQKYWFTMYMGGIGLLNPLTGKIRYTDPEEKGCNELNGLSVYSLMQDSKGNEWVCTETGLMLKGQDGCYHPLPKEMGTLPDDKVFLVHEDDKHVLWIGTEENGLYTYKNSEFIPFRPDLIKGTIQVIFEDSHNNLWVGGSKSGLSCIGTDTVVKYTIQHGLPSNSICGILEDGKNNLWISTHYGLVKFINAVNDPVQDTANIRIYNESDGLSSKQFNFAAAKKSVDGQMYFGSIKGVTYFKPDEIVDNTILPNVVLTRLFVTNEEVLPNQLFKGRDLLTKTISYTDNLEIKQTDKLFTIEFAGLHYANPDKNTYRYILLGFDEDWHYTDASRRVATYTNLNGGRYTFVVEATNNDGIWGNPAELNIRVIPQFTKTIWFKLLIIVIAFVILFGYYIIRMRQIRQQTITLEKLVKLRTQEIEDKNKILMEQYVQLNETNTLLEERQTQIEEQTEELKAQKEKLIVQAQSLEKANNALNEKNIELSDRQEEIIQMNDELKYQTDELEKMNTKLHELNATKDKFFSIIAHDLKNPFQTITGFLELIKTKFKILPEDKILKYIDLSYNTSKNTFNLLENLLNWSRSQTNQIKYDPAVLYLNEILLGNIDAMEANLANKKIKVYTEFPKNYTIFADRNMVNTVIRNILSNAIKFTPLNGVITISLKEIDDSILTCIEDTGIGIPPALLETLFDMERSFTKEGTEGETGTGLGLILCKEFVNRNNGSIWAESEENKGSKFYFTFPKK
ncbi:MAG: hypothetical protein JXB49_01750 [Bacteroidales bacterium]|nr:hypothetical protein [Bacteroidales bacterium]